MVESEREKAEKLKLEMSSKLEKMEHELIKGGEALEKAEKEKEKEQYNLQMKLLLQKKIQDKLIKERQLKEEEKLLIEEN